MAGPHHGTTSPPPGQTPDGPGHAAGWGPLLRCDVGVAADPCGPSAAESDGAALRIEHATYAELSAGGPGFGR